MGDSFQMSKICTLLLVCTSLALSSGSPLPGNVGFMREGPGMWPGAMQEQQRVRRQQGRPLRRVQPGQGRPGRRPRPPQQQERFYKPNPQQKQRPLKPVQRQQQQAPVKKVFKQEPAAERVLQPFQPEEVEMQVVIKEKVQKQEPERIPEIYNEVDRSYDTRPAPSQVYERSAAPQDSLESESIAAPAEQRDIEAAVAAGAAGYAGESYAEPQRLSFQIHGQGGPNAYKFGYDTGVGYNRQFRYEERDNYGVLHGRYGYYDQEGKLQIVNYTADPKTGFHAEGEHVPKPAYR